MLGDKASGEDLILGSGGNRVRRPRPRLLAHALVGRSEALARVERLLARGTASAPVIQITGEAGIGKSRVVLAAAELARADGRLVVEGRARSGDAALPFAVFQDALRGLRRAGVPQPTDDPVAEAFTTHLLPELGGRPDAPAASRSALFEAASRYLAALAPREGLVLVLEDLHWADPSSNALALYLAQTVGREFLTLLVTYRSEEAQAGASLDELRRELRRERLGEEIPLDPLGSAAVAAMLTDILGIAPDERTHAAIVTMSGGVPFVIEEVVCHAVEGDRLNAETGIWRGELTLDPPASVCAVLLARVGELDEADRELLRWAAVIGDQIDARLLGAVADTEGVAALAALAHLRDAGLLVEDSVDPSGLSFSFRHALTREAVLEGLLTAERRRRHARVLDVAEDLYRDASDAPLAELAGHALAAGERGRGFAYSLRAGRRSLQLCGYDEAETHFERALELWTSDLDPAERAGLLLDYGRLLARVRREPRGERLLREARSAFLALGDRIHAAEALGVAAGARLHNGERTGVLAELEAARAELRPEDPPEAHLHLLPLLADTLVRTGDLRAAIRVAEDGLDMTATPLSRAQLLDRVHLLTTLGTARWLGGEPDAGRRALLEALGLARSGQDDVGATRACFELACAHLSATAPEAVRWAEEGLKTARVRRVHLLDAWMCSVRALIHVRAGEWDDASARLAEAESELAEVGPDPVVRLGIDWIRGERLIGLGAMPDALATLARASEEADALKDLQATSRARLGLARARLAAGDPVGAAEAIEPAIARWEDAEGGPLPAPPTLLLTAVEVAAIGRDAAEAERRGQQIAARLRGPRAAYAAALVEVAAGRPPPSGALEAAAGATDAAGWHWEAARMRMVAAEALVRVAGARQEARALVASALERLGTIGSEAWLPRAEDLARRLGSGPPTPSGGASDSLTPREFEVLALLADGRSNRAIAGALVISEATAGRHVANIYSKLRVHSRAQATRIALERGLVGVSPPT